MTPSLKTRLSALFAVLGIVGGACARTPEVPTADSLGVQTSDPVLAQCAVPPRTLHIDTLARGLEVPWDVTFLDDGSALMTERPGRIRRLSAAGALDPEPWAVLPVVAQYEVGLLGIDRWADPEGVTWVYVAAVTGDQGGAAPMRAARGVVRRLARLLNPLWGQSRFLDVVRFRVDPETGAAGPPEQVVRVVPVGVIHGGGALRFGPDGLLYLSNGDGGDPPVAHDPRSAGGKILRFTPLGRPAPLTEGDRWPVYAQGIRHVQGITWHPETGELLLIDHGPSGLEPEGGRTGNDELNAVAPGDDLGWPIVAGASEGGGLRGPLVEWTPAIAPAGLALDPRLDGPWGGGLFMTGLQDGVLRRLPLGPTGSSSAGCEERILNGEFGRLRLVTVAPDGSLWVGSSNRDQRGGPRPDDDLIVRVRN